MDEIRKVLSLLKGKKIVGAFLSLLMLILFPLNVFAAAKEETVKKESSEISAKIDSALDSVNAKYQELETIKSNVTNTEETIKETLVSISETEKNIEKRTEAMAGRMQDIQANGSSFNLVDAVMTAENMSDFVNRVYAVTVLQGAEKSKVESLAADKEQLETLQHDLVSNQQALTEQKEAMEVETVNLEKEVSSLKTELADNEELLNKLANERIAKEAVEKKAAAEAVKQEKEAKVTATPEVKTPEKKVSAAPVEDTPSVKEETVAPEPMTEAPSESNSTSGGQTLTMEATGYSYTEAGLSYYTSTGIDLRQTSRVIAVDPSVIPLGSLVEVSGYGFAVAGDIGGAIVGNRIDLHFNTVDECLNWGRRTVTVTIK